MMVSKIEVIGDTGTYEIQVDPVTEAARCSCPAYRFAKGVKLCKHIIFVAQMVTQHQSQD